MGREDDFYQDYVCEPIKLCEESNVLRLPLNPYVEANAFASEMNNTIRSSPIQESAYQSILELEFSNSLVNQNPVKQILECIRTASSEKIILEVQAPFSILGYLLEPMNLFRELKKNKKEVKKALEHIVDELYEYVSSAIEYGANIISIADPIASMELLGEARYREYVAEYLISLLKKLAPKLDHSVLHLCPRSSFLLERMDLIQCKRINVISHSYTNALLQLASENSVKLVGHQCIHKESAEQIYHIDIIDDYGGY